MSELELMGKQLQQLIINQNELNDKVASSVDVRRKSDSKKPTEWIVAIVALICCCGSILVFMQEQNEKAMNSFQKSTETILKQQAEIFDVRLKSIEVKLVMFSGQGMVDSKQDNRLTAVEIDLAHLKRRGDND